MKPLFIPLNSEPYNQFAAGTKFDELRRYWPRWNEDSCQVDREVILSRGYGKRNRMKGVISGFKKQHDTLFGRAHKEAIKRIYGTLDIDIAVIRIDGLEVINEQCKSTTH